MSQLPLISVIIPTLNEEKFLPILLKSLKEITLPLDIIIVDGGSNDNTDKVALDNFNNFVNEIRFYKSPEAGVSVQKNLGVDNSKGNIIIFCDADIIAPDQKEFVLLLEKFTKEGCVAAGVKIVPDKNLLSAKLIHSISYFVQLSLMKIGKPYLCGAFMITTKEAFKKVGGFDKTLRVSEDVDYSLRVSKHGKVKIFDTPVRVSTRRFEKYGLKWILANPGIILQLLSRGKITSNSEKFYPFGEY